MRSRSLGVFALLAFTAVSGWSQQPGPGPGPAPGPAPRPSAPTFTTEDITNIATTTNDLCPGCIVSIVGSNLAGNLDSAPGLPLPTTLSGSRVLVNDVAAPILLASPEQINIQIPWEARIGAGTIVVQSGLLSSPRVAIAIKRAAPGILTGEDFRAFFVNADGLLNSNASPIQAGLNGRLYALGLGPVEGRPVTGAPSPAPGLRATLPVRVLIGNQAAESVVATLSTAFPGIYEIALRLPAEAGYGVHEARVIVDGQTSNPGQLTLWPSPRARGDSFCAIAPVREGRPILPPGATEIESVDEDFVSGDVHSLYPSANTGNDQWYSSMFVTSDGCPVTIDDGTQPPAEDNDVPDEFKDALSDLAAISELNDLIDQHAKAIASLTLDPVQLPRVVPPNFVYTPPPNPCQPPPGQQVDPRFRAFCVELPRSPFQGKDIIYVHGLSIEVLKAVVEGETVPNWGFGLPSLTYLSYFNQRADKSWDDHIQKFLASRGASNRYMIVGWSSAQRIEYAANAMLYQIAEAMINGTRVVARPNDPRTRLGFCANGCVIVSHSTGALLTDVAMSLADTPNYQQNYGNIGFIPQRMTTHVSLGGAFVGSKYATLAVGLGRGVLAASKLACVVGSLFTGVSVSDCQDGLYDPISQSILVDLMPLRAHGMWGPVIRQSRVKTLTVAGGNHESLWPLKRLFLKGFDDGVVNMDSACARDLAPTDWVAGTGPTGLPSLWDRGMPNLLRSLRFYSEQVKEPQFQLRAASACTPYKTPWGMLVKPIWSLKKNPTGFYPNHFAFVQTAENHGGSRRWFSNEDGLQGGEQPGMEDVRANHDDMIYTMNLVDPSMKNAQVESIRGRAIRFRLFGKRYKVYLWKRTYHRLSGWESLPAAEYVYRYVR